MIARMEKLFAVGPKRLAPSVLLYLQRAGVVQIDQVPGGRIGEYRLEPGEENSLRKWESVATSTDHTLRLLGLEPDLSAGPYDGEPDEAAAAVVPFEQRAAALVERREALRDELQVINRYGQVVELLARAVQGLDESPRLALLPFVIEKKEDPAPLRKELTSSLDGRFLLAVEAVGDATVAAIVVRKPDAEEARGILSHHGLAELPRMREYAGMSLAAMASRFAERSSLAPDEIGACEEELRRLKEEGEESLKGIWNRARDESLRFRALREMASGRYGFALFGWAPAVLKDRVAEAMRQFNGQVLYTFEPADGPQEVERVPVMLENPEWARPFESLISFLNTPRYDGWDPTRITAAFFPLWFGMIVGDIGYGLVFAGAAWYLSTYARNDRVFSLDFFKIRMSPGAVAQLVRVMKPMIAWTILWGIVYGEFFGDLLQRLGVFGTAQYPGLIPVLIPRTETATTANMLILVSIGFGAIQVLHGFYVKAQLTRRRGQREHFWEACGYFGGVAALVLFGYAFMVRDFKLALLVPMMLGAVLFCCGVALSRTPLMIAELPTQGGHILSYIRIYAVGLASAILANLSTDLGFALSHLWGATGVVVAVIIGIVTGLLMHAVLLVLLTVGHVLQPIRLIWVEFFTKFDFYSSSGRPYRPLKSVGESSNNS